MIKISGTLHRSFIFPADLPTAFAYYADMDNTFSHLPHISLVEQHENGGLRMLFSTTELGIYRVRIYCDLQVEIDAEAHILRMIPFHGVEAVDREAGVSSLTAPGSFSSASVFYDEGAQTRINYTLYLSANLPVPLGLIFMPERAVGAIARSITQRRFHETVDGFIERSLAAYSPGGKTT